MEEHGPAYLLEPERARGLMLASLTELGMPDDQAAICADCFLFASLRGVDSHGLIALFPTMANNLKDGKIHTDVEVTVEQETTGAARLEGHFAAGPVIGVRAIRLAMEKARATGVGMVVAANCNHFGAASYYCSLAAREGMIGVAMCDAYPNVVPFGGTQALHGTNPIAYAVPNRSGAPILLDIATSVAAFGQVAKARRRGQPIPAGWALDAEGQPTTDANAATMLMPFGGHKGYGFALLVDLLCAALAGSYMTREIRERLTAREPVGQSFFFLVIDPAAIVPIEQFYDRVDRLIADVHDTRPAQGFQGVLLPGELEERTYLQRSTEGIPLYTEDWDAILTNLGKAGLDSARLEARYGPAPVK